MNDSPLEGRLGRCAICGDAIWLPTEGWLCLEHEPFLYLRAAVSMGLLSEFGASWPRYTQRQTTALPESVRIIPWHIAVGDINRLARAWLDGWDDETEGAA